MGGGRKSAGVISDGLAVIQRSSTQRGISRDRLLLATLGRPGQQRR